MNAERITLALRGNWYRSYGTAPCPICQPEARKGQNALTLADGTAGRLLLNCKKGNCSFRDLNDALRGLGLVDGRGHYAPPVPGDLSKLREAERAAAEKKAKQARTIWGEALPIIGSLAEVYLRSRSITAPLPDTLRFHPEAFHGPTAKRFPAMIALIEDGDTFAIHRTFLRPDGSEKAEVPDGTAKMMLGASRGGHVEVAKAEGPLVVAEGLETALSLASGLLRCPATIWATLSTSGMSGLRLPDRAGRLTVATDGDEPGRNAGRSLAMRTTSQGWVVSLLPAPQGRDWNDVLAAKKQEART